jgi:hypothetical protein
MGAIAPDMEPAEETFNPDFAVGFPAKRAFGVILRRRYIHRSVEE